MKHFTAEEWVDFARGTLGEDQKVFMQAHLNHGCQRCRREAKTWLRVQKTASRQHANEPDDSVVRFVKGAFALNREYQPKHSRRLFAQVLFDSSREPLPVGVRSSGPASRQLLFGDGDLRIDLRLEPKIDSENISVIGQILNSVHPRDNRVSASVAVLRGGKVVSEANTNRFGEFQLECGLAARLELRIKFPTGQETSISLVDPVRGVTEAHSEAADSKLLTGILGTSKRTGKLV